MDQNVDRRVRFWHARFWHGMSLSVWLRLLFRNGFRVSPARAWHVLSITPIAVLNTVVAWAQHLFYGRRIAQTKLAADPIFVIGHWRSGTTLLHELLLKDEQFIAPTTYECMSPHHFVLSSQYVEKLSFLVPKKRPMDDMKAGWRRPQEDEFALLNLGLPSPYEQIAFPASKRRVGTLSLDGLSDAEKHKWKIALDTFLRSVTLNHAFECGEHKQIIVKSPTHTARIKTLLSLYPNAKFLLITRQPSAVFGSTLKLWRSLGDAMSLQELGDDFDAGLGARVHDEFQEMMTALNADREQIPKGQFHHLTYEDLMQDPVQQLEGAYRALDLDRFSSTAPKIVDYFAARTGYRVGDYDLSAQQVCDLANIWAPVMADFGYAYETSNAKGTKSTKSTEPGDEGLSDAH